MGFKKIWESETDKEWGRENFYYYYIFCWIAQVSSAYDWDIRLGEFNEFDKNLIGFVCTFVCVCVNLSDVRAFSSGWKIFLQEN